MKKINFLFMLMLTLSIGVFTSCTDEEADPPTIVVTVEGTPTYEIGSTVTFHLVIAGNEDLVDFWADESTTGIPLSTITNVDPSDAFDEEGNWVDFKKNLTKVELDYTYTIPTTVGDGTEITISFEVTDKKDNVTTKDETFTAVGPAATVNRYTTVLMGSQDNNTIGSFYSTSTNEVFMQADAAANKDIIDLIYYFGANNKATVAAPADDDSQIVFSTLDNTYNLTSFNVAPGLDATAFDALTSVDAISSLTYDVTKATELAVGDIVAFETVNGKYGAFKVTAIAGTTYGESSTLTIEVVVEI
jgi:hypothetical protein